MQNSGCFDNLLYQGTLRREYVIKWVEKIQVLFSRSRDIKLVQFNRDFSIKELVSV